MPYARTYNILYSGVAGRVHFDVRYSIDRKINVKRVHNNMSIWKGESPSHPHQSNAYDLHDDDDDVRRVPTRACVCVRRAGDVIVPLFWAAASVCFLAKHHRYIRGGRECSKRRKQLSRPLCLCARAVAFKSDFADRIIGVCSLLFDAGVVCTHWCCQEEPEERWRDRRRKRVCVCVCARERERESEWEMGRWRFSKTGRMLSRMGRC